MTILDGINLKNKKFEKKIHTGNFEKKIKKI